ncbi:uncharacterized protein LOC142573898 [Dermacentor variabilis]|uniref:uncharacterized protein LOC142573898 n=1 Tax=Dermacentor variabilis TaxID=34621 RepID=UPI003F5BE4ED
MFPTELLATRPWKLYATDMPRSGSLKPKKTTSTKQVEAASTDDKKVPAVGKVVIISPSDGVTQVKTLDALKVSKELQAVTPEGISKVRLNLRLNLLAVDTNAIEATAKLLTLKTLCSVPVQVREPHGSYGSVGVVYGIPPGVTERQLEASIRSRAPIVAVRIPRPPGGPAVLTFASSQLPHNVLVGLVEHRVHPHVDRPPRCRRCGRIGHVQVVCCSPATCRRCGGAHGRALCPASRPACVNCGQEHDPCSNACPKWKEALRIARYRSLNKVDYATAKAAVARRAHIFPPLMALARSRPPASHRDVYVPGDMPRKASAEPRVTHTVDKLVHALLWLCQKFL